jgi:hypothetical protein
MVTTRVKLGYLQFEVELCVMARRPTGCRLAAASGWYCCPKINDLVREAVGCTGVLGGDYR